MQIVHNIFILDVWQNKAFLFTCKTAKEYKIIILLLFIIGTYIISHYEQKVQIQNIVYCCCKLE